MRKDIKTRCALLLSLAASVMVTVISYSSHAQLASEPGVYLTPYRIAGQARKALYEFDYFRLDEVSTTSEGEIATDRHGDVPVKGELYTKRGVTYVLRTGLLRKSARGFRELTFTTESVTGVSYVFRGAFLKKARQVGVQFVWLEGTLSKYKTGRLVYRARLRLYQATQQ